MYKKTALLKYVLRLADNALIHGHRMSEWCSRGPFLEEDLALTNIALDYLGRANLLYEYAADIGNDGVRVDDFVYKRAERDFLNNLIVELPKGDFAFTMAKQFLLSAYEYQFYKNLAENTSDERLKAIANKTIKEIKYHLQHANDWCIRLGKGTSLSNQKLQFAFSELWMFTGELFEMYDEDAVLATEEIAVDLNEIKEIWCRDLNAKFEDFNIVKPIGDFMQTGGRRGIHTEHMGYILAEMQYLTRAYPDAIW